MKKWIITGCVLLVLLILFVPVSSQMNDGGTVQYHAVVYDIYDVQKISPVNVPSEEGKPITEFIEGIIIEVFGFEVFNNTNPRIDI